MTPTLPEVQALLRIGDWHNALRLAVRIKHLNRDPLVSRGWEACRRPELYKQMQQKPEEHIATAIAILRKRLEGITA